MIEKLQQLGFRNEEAELYLALLQMGGGYASQLSRKAAQKRSSSYHTLQKLVERGLVRKVMKGSVQYFVPEEPERIVEIQRSRLDAAAKILPELQSIQNSLANKPRVKFFQHKSGIEEIFEQTLSAEGEILGYTNLALLVEIFPGYLKRYTRERMKRRIKVRYLSPRPEQGMGFVEELFPRGLEESLLEILFVNPREFPFQHEVAIYGEKVAIMSLSQKEQIALLIESKTLAVTMKAIFDLAWVGATGFIAI
jgi:sugar-specific transcriptional regulator TrmB